MKSFSELYPDYPIKPPPRFTKLKGWLFTLGVLTVIGSATGYVLYNLSIAQIPMPAMAGLPQPLTPASEKELLESLTVEQLGPIGGACLQDGDADCVKTIFNRILQIEPNNLNALASLGMIEIKLGDRERATQHFNKYLELGGEKSRVSRFLNQ